MATLVRQWDDTWHAGTAFAHRAKGQPGYSVGFSYQSSPVDEDHRTFDLLVDKFYKLSASYLWEGVRPLDFSLGGTLYPVGDASMDVTAQGVRAAGKFDKHRMHNNIMVMDNAVAIVGGRNIGNDYFGVATDANYRDLDIAAAGPVVRDSSSVFDHFWNGPSHRSGS